MEYAVLFISWATYYGLHSFLASNRMKAMVPLSKRNYRLAYSIFSVAGLFLLLWMNGAVNDEPWFARTGPVEYLALFLSAVGIIVARAAFRNLSVSEFLGLKSETGDSLIIHGIYAYVRHPLYTATVLITLGFFLFDGRPATAISVGTTWLYLPIGIFFEEKKLIEVFGKAYLDYRENVAAIIPFVL